MRTSEDCTQCNCFGDDGGFSTMQCRVQYLNDTDPFNCASFPEPARPLLYTFLTDVPLANQVVSLKRLLGAPHYIEDCALQLCKHNGTQNDYGMYLDLESSVDEQMEDLEGFTENRKNVIILRTQLAVRVQVCIDKLSQSRERELRRALFSLKQMFQEDKDLVHEFVDCGGLDCLIAVGSVVDHNYQNYILRALGQVMLYVDGMNGVIAHNATVQWLYSLINCSYRSVAKMSLKLLLLFVEYTEFNSLLLLQAVSHVDTQNGVKLCKNLMSILTESAATDTELLVYTMTLINKTLHGIPDQDLFYDVTDALEEQGMDSVVQRLVSREGVDPDLVEQLQIYEVVLQHEDEGADSTLLSGTGNNIRKVPRVKSEEESRKSRRVLNAGLRAPQSAATTDKAEMSAGNMSSSQFATEAVVMPTEQNHLSLPDTSPCQKNKVSHHRRREREKPSSRENLDVTPQKPHAQLTSGSAHGNSLSMSLQHNTTVPAVHPAVSTPDAGSRDVARRDLEKETSACTLTDRQRPVSASDITHSTPLSNHVASVSPAVDLADGADIGVSDVFDADDSAGTVSQFTEQITRAREGLMSASRHTAALQPSPLVAESHSETNVVWNQISSRVTQLHQLKIRDLDFSDLLSADDTAITHPSASCFVPGTAAATPPPPPTYMIPPPPPLAGSIAPRAPPPPPSLSTPRSSTLKTRKTMKLHWKEAKPDVRSVYSSPAPETIWSQISRDIGSVKIDYSKLEHLFETRTVDMKPKDQSKHDGAKKEITILDTKRSNAINIGLTALPKPDAIKTAIMKLDNSVINREGIEKILTTMMPTDEERTKLQEFKLAADDVVLGSAEQFLAMLCNIPDLSARLRLWAFKLDYETVESEIAEPLSDLKQGISELRQSRTLKCILSTILAVGNFLNGTEAVGFLVDYLSHVAEVKDTAHKQPLIFHVANIVLDEFPDATDLYSEIGSVTRCAKIDWGDMASNLLKLETDCRMSWDRLHVLEKHDSAMVSKNRLSEFMKDCTERIIVLKAVHEKVLSRFHQFLQYFGYSQRAMSELNIGTFCKMMSDFALEYRTTRDRVIHQRQKKADQRQRNMTRGKMIVETENFAKKSSSTKGLPVVAEAEDALVSCLLQSADGWRSRRTMGGLDRKKRDTAITGRRKNVSASAGGGGGEIETLDDSQDDDILESVIKSVTSPSSRQTRDRHRARTGTRTSLRRTLKGGLTQEELAAVLANT